MAKKRSIKSIFALGTLMFVSILSVASLGALVFTAVKAALDINTLPSFSATVSGNTFYCYRINGEGNAKNIAISWGEAPENTPDETLTVPETLNNDDTNDTTNYTVVAIAKSGFSRCDFKKISLPDTILEIGNGAFAYCEKLSEFRVPPLVQKIEASTFVDCRGLKTITYTENIGTEQAPNYVESTKNTIIQEIGDHAFDSCVELISFECPKSLTKIGVSAFQNCKKITRFYFPEKTTYGNITVESYAFADCANLIWVYFEENLTTIKDYAFANCNTNMLFHYGHDFGSSTPTDPTFSDTEWNRKSIDGDNPARYGFEETNHLIYSVDGYLGLKIGVEKSAVYLNSWRKTNESKTNTIKLINASANYYAIVYQWNNPGKDIKLSTDDFYYYRYNGGGNGSGVLTIPSTVKYNNNSIPVKIIQAEAFKECTDLKEVHFKNNIVQIQEKAFFNCSNIDTLDFDGVTTLKEIGPNIFGGADNKSNSKITALELPASLEYIGPNAFKNLYKVANLSFTTSADRTAGRHPNLKVIGNNAFNQIGRDISTRLRIHIPCSLDDSQAIKASMNAQGSNWAAVGGNSFVSSKIITIEMDNCPTSTHTSNNISLAANAFNGCTSLVRFVAGDNLCLIGSSAFANCGTLKEMFLTTAKASAYATTYTTKTYVWGTTNAGESAGEGIFGSTLVPNLVIYLDGLAPGSIESQTSTSLVGEAVWNAEGTAADSFSNGLGLLTVETFKDNARVDENTSKHHQGRKIVPTYYSVNFSMINKTSIIYYDVHNKTTMAQGPDTTPDYFAGVLTFVLEGSYYTAAHYYVDNDHTEDEINLTGITHTYDTNTTVNISANLTKIGPGAFASNKYVTVENQAPCPGKYFILPTTVTEIGERAFYRKATDPDPSVETHADDVVANGVRVVTFVSGNTGANYGANYVYSTIKTNYDTNKYGYCNIPDVTKIENDAFFNNRFKAINLGAGLSYLGTNAFFTLYGSALSSINFSGTNSIFTIANNGVYYTAGGNSKKTLIYQEQNDESSTDFVVDDNTVAIGPSAVAYTNYETANLKNVTHIYGSAFQGSSSLEEVTNGTKLQYIGAMPDSVIAYKVEKMKYVGRPNNPPNNTRTDKDDLTSYGIINNGSTSNERITITFRLDDDHLISQGWISLYKFVSDNGTILYGASKNTNASLTDNGGNTFLFDIEKLTDDVDILDTSDSTLMSHLDTLDYRKTTNPKYPEYQTRTSAFKDCESLTTFNFKGMTDLVKIGPAAFKGCSNLDTTSGETYKYYKYTTGTKTVSLADNQPTGGNKGVLDLSSCTNLRSIGARAFEGCSKIKFVHLPYTKGKLFVGRDLQSPFNNGNSSDMVGQPIFSNYDDDATKKITILVGDHEVKANQNTRTWNDYCSVWMHYRSGWNANNTVYYYAETINDIRDLTGGGSGIKYWTTDARLTDGYILFTNRAEAQHYFNNYSSIVWPS